MATQFRVWWIPQVPMRAFEFTVPDVATGRLLCDALGQYDEFQLKNRIKPDYCNAGGISFNHPNVTSGEWWDWPDDEEEATDLTAEINASGTPALAGESP